jgi:hypothetical protein
VSIPLKMVRRLVLVAALLITAFPLAPARAEDGPATLDLRVASQSVTLQRGRGSPVYLDLGVYLASLGGPFELNVARPDYSQPLEVEQVTYNGTDPATITPLPSDLPVTWRGLGSFFRIDIRKDGQLVRSRKLKFCPNDYERQRINDEGPTTPHYPYACFSNPFTQGVVWGVENGWATNAIGFRSMWLAPGHYDVTVQIEPRYVQLFDTDTVSVDLDLTVKLYGGGRPHHVAGAARRSTMQPAAAVPDDTDPDPSTLPDLRPLPAWSINPFHERRTGRDFLTFAANIWVAGAQDMVVEGFRQEGADTMDAYQYFYENGEPVGRAPVGTLAYDRRRGHEHWHFKQFAGYSLLDATQTEVVRSKKEAFCLAPTDAINLLLPNVDLTQNLGFGTQCGGASALWVREVLPLGWGDTYYQFIPGQSFNITNVPNGTYYIEVEANPSGLLYEQDLTNNTELRQVILKGTPGHRRVEVPPWNGIDTDG